MVKLLIYFSALSCLTAGEVRLGNHTFSVAEGYSLSVAATQPLVDRPVNFTFDEAGALYVTDSSGSNASPVEQNQNPTSKIVKLVDADGDGVFDKRYVYAEKLAFSSGTMWLEGSL
jgi:hypothetical protein